ncbi:patatin-like protein, partial [Frankia tisae]|uniref:patatin-like protein n=2 Tax=Frankia tisae TaxID=2950104 RepID=UPI0021C1CA0F
MRDEATQEVRLAVVMTGGASLAVWMGGVATEINLATSPEHTRADDADAAVAARYARLAAILDVELSVDVLAGASAGGINATMLGFANALDGDLSPLRDLWLSLGSLNTLMRTPDEKAYPSLLRGDTAVLPALHTALGAVAGTTAARGSTIARPTSVFVTTTILRGEVAEHTDSLGGTMYDVDYRGLFVFSTPDLTDPAAIPRLALSARASSAFPGAFEPAYVPVGHALDDTHPDMARYVNSARSFHASDGGILVNRPIGPALAAIFDRPAERQVRRVLTYVVPSPR